jgi:hypothetical protein
MKKLEKKLRKEWKNILFNLAVMVLTLLAIIYFYKNSILTISLVSIIALIALIKWRSKITVVLFIGGGILFGILEILVVDFGAWQYNNPSVLGVPIWLFVIWGVTCGFIYQMALEIRKLGVKDG